MGHPSLITVAFWIGLCGLAHADSLPPYAEKFPFPYPITSYGEINGSYFFSARGVIAETPAVAVGRLKRAFGTEMTFAQSSANGKHGVFWQLRGMKTLSSKEKKKFQASLQRLGGATFAKIQARLAMPPVGTVFWLFDLMCSLHIIDIKRVCLEIRPFDIAIVMDGAMPKPQWQTVSLEAKADGTHFSWSVWPEVKLTSLFGIGDPKERKANCGRAKHPLPNASECLIIGRFISSASAGRIEISRTALPLAAAEKYIYEQLGANGWTTDPVFDPDTQGKISTLAPSISPAAQSMALPGFRFLRNAVSGATLMVRLRAEPESGTQIIVIEMEAGA